ncbi:hypothetical protein ACGC1H_001990 [Rhizoctonia solani]
MRQAQVKLPVRRQSSSSKLQETRRMLRRHSAQALLSQNHSGNSLAFDIPDYFPGLPPFAHSQDDPNLDELIDKDIPPTNPNFWDEVMRDWHYHDFNQDDPIPDDTAATQSRTDKSSELDNISLVSIPNYLDNLDASTYGLSLEDVMDADDIVEAAVEAHTLLEVEDIQKLSLFDLYVRYKPTKALFTELIRQYQPIDSARGTRIPSIKRLRTHAWELSGLSAKRHHCCVNSCVAFIGYMEHMETCPACHEPRLNSAGNLRNIFTSIPLIPQLCALFACPITATKMSHRHNYTNDKNTMDEIFNSGRYLELCNLYVEIDGKAMPYK